MSMKLMVRVLEEADLTRPQQAVLVAMAENANDDGSHCYPSVDLIAWKAGYRPRNVVDILRDLRALGVLEVVTEATARRPTEYVIRLDRAPRKLTFEEWQEANGRHAERKKKAEASPDLGVQSHGAGVQSHVPLARENAPVQSDEGCNLTSLGVQSHGAGVQSHVINHELARENAPEPVNDPAIDPVKEPVSGADAPEPPSASEPSGNRPLPRHGAAQILVSTLYEDVLKIGPPTNYQVAVGQAALLVRAGCTPEELREIAIWLMADAFWAERGITMTVILRQRDNWRASKTTPVPLPRKQQPPNIATHGHDEDTDWFGEYGRAKGSHQ